MYYTDKMPVYSTVFRTFEHFDFLSKLCLNVIAKKKLLTKCTLIPK